MSEIYTANKVKHLLKANIDRNTEVKVLSCIVGCWDMMFEYQGRRILGSDVLTRRFICDVCSTRWDDERDFMSKRTLEYSEWEPDFLNSM